MGKPIITHAIVVLNDGETWSTLQGCKILHVTQEAMERLASGEEPNDLEPSDIVAKVEL